MFRLLRRADPTDLLTSRLYDERSFYSAFIADLKSCRESVVIESPYLTVRRSAQLAKIFKRLARRGIKVRINTREPYHHMPRLREQSVESIKILKSAGAKVYVCSDLRHRKLAILDTTTMWEGSLNILSQSRSREIMRRTQSREMCRQMLRFTGINNLFW